MRVVYALQVMAKWMTTREVADLLGLSRKTIYRAIWEGQVPARKFRRSWRVWSEDAEAWGAGRREPDGDTIARARAPRTVNPLRAKLLAIEKGAS